FADPPATGVAPPLTNVAGRAVSGDGSSPADPPDRPVLAVPGGVSLLLPYDARCLGLPEWTHLGQRLASAENAQSKLGLVIAISVAASVVLALVGGAVGYAIGHAAPH
ncbi:MAG: hypothetical protein KGR26_16095, partial [Cyanobacteria bacterium REEB65]|nr:hypothetical protein [Cyanobacteria bacterium REEB65]